MTTRATRCPPAQPGHIWVRSVTLIREYWNRPEANAREFRDGWFNSGDIGFLDADGYLYLTDRAKDMVIRGGENIFPLEVEIDADGCAAKCSKPSPSACPTTSGARKLAMVVRLKRPGSMDENAVREFLSARLAAFKVPRYVSFTEEPLPRNATEKVLKKDVRHAFIATHDLH